MSDVIVREAWPPGQTPGSLAYFCDVLDEPAPIPPDPDPDYPERVRQRVSGSIVRLISTRARPQTTTTWNSRSHRR